MNGALPSLHGGSLEITFTVPLNCSNTSEINTDNYFPFYSLWIKCGFRTFKESFEGLKSVQEKSLKLIHTVEKTGKLTPAVRDIHATSKLSRNLKFLEKINFVKTFLPPEKIVKYAVLIFCDDIKFQVRLLEPGGEYCKLEIHFSLPDQSRSWRSPMHLIKQVFLKDYPWFIKWYLKMVKNKKIHRNFENFMWFY